MRCRSRARSSVLSRDVPLRVTIEISSPGDIRSTNRRAASLTRGTISSASVTSSRINAIDRPPRSASAGVTKANVSIGTR